MNKRWRRAAAGMWAKDGDENSAVIDLQADLLKRQNKSFLKNPYL